MTTPSDLVSRAIERSVERRRAALQQWRAQRRDDDDVPPTLEVEIRLGVRASGNGNRLSPLTCEAPRAGERRWFSSNIGGTHFFGAFEALGERADEVTPLEDSVSNHFAAEVAPSSVRCELPVGTLERAERWTNKHVLERADYGFPAWFDVRVALSEEQHIDAPAAVLEARAIGKRVRNSWNQERTRLGVPKHSRMRHRRSLRFAAARWWRIDFTEVETSSMVHTDQNSAGHFEHTMRHDETTLEIEVEYVGPDDGAPDEARRQAMLVLSRLAVALGRTPAEVKRRTLEARQRAEVRQMWTQM